MHEGGEPAHQQVYRILNLESFFTPGVPVEDGIRWSTSPTVTMLFSTLGFLFIRMHSLLDHLAKLACEIKSIRTDFKSYPKLASSNFLFGDRKKLKKLARERVAGTLFEACDEVIEVELIRNLLIHDGLLDDMPKAYEAIEGGKAIERYVLMPDRRDGRVCHAALGLRSGPWPNNRADEENQLQRISFPA